MAARLPRALGRPALDDGDVVVGHDELAETVALEGEWLARHGERYAVLADNGVGWAVADLALLARGLPSVPLPGFFTPGQLQHALDDAGVDALLTDDPRKLHALLTGWYGAGTSGRSGLTLFRRCLDAAARPSLPSGTVKITYTSGSTGRPKGVCLSAAQLDAVALSLAEATRWLDIERHLCLMPLATLLENIAGIYAPLLAEATCLLPPSGVTGMSYSGLDVQRLLECIERSRPHSLVLVPELLRVLVGAAEHGWRVPGSLRFVAVGGAPVSLALLERAERVRLPVFEGYGLSECASVVSLNTPGARRPGSVGRPLPHASVRIGDDGQIMVRGPAQLGYLGEPASCDGGEWATGDLGEIDADGYLYVRGRLRNVYITSLGRNVAPEWVERELVQQPPLRHVLVHGEARPYAVALVVPVDESVADAAIDHAIEAANRRLPEYARVRGWVRAPQPFTPGNGLLTANGRLRRDAILERHGALLAALYEPDTTIERGER